MIRKYFTFIFSHFASFRKTADCHPMYHRKKMYTSNENKTKAEHLTFVHMSYEHVFFASILFFLYSV